MTGRFEHPGVAGRTGRAWAIAALALTLTLLPIPAQGGATCGVATAAVAAYWSANGDANDALLCHDGTLQNGATFGEGRIGQGFQLDGVDDFVEVPDHPMWTLGGRDFVLSLFANFDATPASSLGNPCCVFLGADEGPGTLNKWFFAWGGGVLSFHVNGPGVASAFLAQAPFAPTPNVWYHLVLTRLSDVFTIYVDGVQVGSEANNVVIPNPNASLRIGHALDNVGFFPGRIDEVVLARLV